MSILTDLPQAVVDTILTGLPELATCRVMEGRFDEGELARVGTRTPAVLVARLGAKQNKPNPDWQMYGYRLQMAAFAVTSSSLGQSAEVHLANIAGHILGLIPEHIWGLGNVGPAETVAEVPVVTKATRSKKVLISAITWEQPVALTAPDPAAPMPIGLYFGQSPAIGADNVDAYDKIGDQS